VETIYACSRALQKEWGAKLGQKRFDGLMDVLRDLADDEEDDEAATAD
jgi:hypothetical protein